MLYSSAITVLEENLYIKCYIPTGQKHRQMRQRVQKTVPWKLRRLVSQNRGWPVNHPRAPVGPHRSSPRGRGCWRPGLLTSERPCLHPAPQLPASMSGRRSSRSQAVPLSGYSRSAGCSPESRTWNNRGSPQFFPRSKIPFSLITGKLGGGGNNNVGAWEFGGPRGCQWQRVFFSTQNEKKTTKKRWEKSYLNPNDSKAKIYIKKINSWNESKKARSEAAQTDEPDLWGGLDTVPPVLWVYPATPRALWCQPKKEKDQLKL